MKKGSLELNWINKDKSLYYEYDKDGNPSKPIWVGKNDIRVAEPRILKLVKEYGDCSKLKDPLDNVLIKGDNLLALRTLVELFKDRSEKDKVKCVYLDPPFNTGNAFENYEDNLAHSEWLSMMKDRLISIRSLVKDEGIIMVHIDYQELSYLKVLMDELFGRNNYIGQINWQRVPEGRTLLGQGESDLTKSTEYILIYSKNRIKGKLNKDVKKFIDSTDKIVDQYSTILNVKDEGKLVDSFIDSSGEEVKVFIHKNFELNNLSKKVLRENRDKYIADFIKNYKKMVQSVGIQTESTSQQKILSYCSDKDTLYSVEYTPSKGKRKKIKLKSYYYNGRKFLFSKDYSTLIKGKLFRESDMNDFWRSEELPVTGTAKEGNVNFRRSKKPEALIKRILKLSTAEDEIVLDSFLGSGTTAAVAHKMNRRWIGIEIGNHADTHCVKRLNLVINKNNPDKTGISKDKDINWKGGGGFRYYRLGDTLIKDNDINWELNKNGELIAKAVFLNTGFKFEKKIQEGVFFGKRKTKHALCIIDKDLKVLTKKELESIINKIPKDYDLLEVFTNLGLALKQDELKESIQIKKIPYAIQEKFSEVKE
jgi:adenine-specific DNA-methyltransferase